LLAREMAAILQGRGWPVDLPIPAQIVESSSGKKFIWLLRNGLPWFLKRSVDLVPAAIYLMVLEIIKITCSAIKEQGRRIRR